MKKNTQFKYLLIISIITAFTGQIYISPFGTSFRFSFAVVLLTVLILRFEQVPIITSGILTGSFVFLFRASIMMASGESDGVREAFYNYYPAMIYYVVFAMLIKYLDIRSNGDKPINLIANLWISDVVSNLVEIVIRGRSSIGSLEFAITMIILIGFIRSVASFIMFSGVKLYNLFLLREESERRHREMLIERSGLKTDLFFLSKNSQDIERAMASCYNLYEQIKNNHCNCNDQSIDELKGSILNLTREIHEIKKDNMRVFWSISKLIKGNEQNQDMAVSYIFEILYWNNKRMLEEQNKDVSIEFSYDKDFVVTEFHSIISILNNFIINSIEAIDESGSIHVNSTLNDKYWVLTVEDNGPGIPTELYNIIFEPGFSTKYNPSTGQMSTGVGLTHIKHLVTNVFSGKLEIESKTGQGTKFFVYIPRKYI